MPGIAGLADGGTAPGVATGVPGGIAWVAIGVTGFGDAVLALGFGLAAGAGGFVAGGAAWCPMSIPGIDWATAMAGEAKVDVANSRATCITNSGLQTRVWPTASDRPLALLMLICRRYSLRTMVRSQAMSLTISGLAREGGVGVETIRYYQRRGLIEKPRAGGGIARYGEEAVRRLRFIRSAQSAGFSLKEVSELLSLDASEDRGRARAIASVRIASLDKRIAELESARSWLTRLARECGERASGPCPILSALEQG